MSKGLEALENIGFEPLYQNEDGSYWRVRDEDKEDFETIEKELKVLEIIRTRGINLIVPSNVFSNEHIDIQVFTRSLSKEELELVKEVIGL